MQKILVFVLLSLTGCGLKAPPQAPVAAIETAAVAVALNDEAVRGVSDATFRQLLHEHWEATMKSSPMWATELGDHRFDDQLGDNSEKARKVDSERRRSFLARARSLENEELNEADQLTLTLFVESLQTNESTDICGFAEWNISPRNNALGSINYLGELHKIPTPEDGANLLVRYQQIPGFVKHEVLNLRLGMAGGKTPNAESLRLTIDMLDRELATDLTRWPLMLPVERATEDWEPEPAGVFVERITALVDGEIRAALVEYRDFLRDDLMPVARDKDHEGVLALPNGEACYAALVRKFTTLPKSADEVHETGIAELARIHAYTIELGERVYGLSDLESIFEKLRTDPELYFTSSEEVQAKAEKALALARSEMVNWFGVLPKAECDVKPVPDFEAPYTTIAYYRGPSPDGARPGTYYVNVYAPETRPRHEAEVLAFHEAIPGHHLQIAIAQELDETPAFRRHMGMTAYVEGWALYTEQLSDEMGLYSGDIDRLGMASFELWRAARLVVDTGLHAKGWTREQAVQFMLENTPLAPNNIRNEVDRYITTPGQAISYKTGQLEIWRLRRFAEAELGERFDIKGFHDTVLGGGAVSLPVLGSRVEAWVRSHQSD